LGAEFGERFADHRPIQLEPARQSRRHGRLELRLRTRQRVFDRPKHSFLVVEDPLLPDEEPATEVLAVLDRAERLGPKLASIISLLKDQALAQAKVTRAFGIATVADAGSVPAAATLAPLAAKRRRYASGPR
jgi:hypothetical protein